jgi:hypothetical protein
MAEKVGQLSQLILGALARELHPGRRTWGEAPDVLMLYTSHGRMRAGGLRLPDALWAKAETAMVLAWVADCAEDMTAAWRPEVPVSLVAVGMRCEAWYVRDLQPDEVGTLSMAEVRAHPRATKGRFACAVDRNAITYGVETDAEGTLLGGRVVKAGDRSESASGAIPEALDRILAAFLNIRMPVRPDPPG